MEVNDSIPLFLRLEKGGQNRAIGNPKAFDTELVGVDV